MAPPRSRFNDRLSAAARLTAPPGPAKQTRPIPGGPRGNHDPIPEISPDVFAITIAGREFALRWYALAYLAGLLIGWRIIVALMRRPRLWGGAAPMRPEQVEELLTWVVVG